MREFDVGESLLKKKCPICNKKFKIGEKVILCPIQASKKGWINAIALPIHADCYWVDKESEDEDSYLN